MMEELYFYELELQYQTGNPDLIFRLDRVESIEQETLYRKSGSRGKREKIVSSFTAEFSILRVGFSLKYKALVLLREMFLTLTEKKPEARKLVDKAWLGILFPSRNREWFLGNMTEAEWEQTFFDDMQRSLDEA